ncbi:MAG: hypothetical protein ACRBF0_03355 [Calditrichia bacterium]
MKHSVITALARTPFCPAGAALSEFSAEELGAIALREMLLRAELSPAEVDHVFVGCTEQVLSGINVAGAIAKRCGLPERVGTTNISGKVTAGLQAIWQACRAIQQGDTHSVVVAGISSVSNFPVELPAEFYRWFNGRRGKGIGAAFNWARHLGTARFNPTAGLQYVERDPLSETPVADLSNMLARTYSISRESQDDYAATSRQRLQKANSLNLPAYITPVYLTAGDGQIVTRDGALENLPEATQYALAEPIGDDPFGTATDLNLATGADGAAVLLLLSEQRAKTLGQKALARISSVGFATAPSDMAGCSSAFAMAKVLKDAALSLSNLDILQIHESSASAILAMEAIFSDRELTEQALGGSGNIGKFNSANVNLTGGTLAIGDALAASGPECIITAVDAMQNGGGETALAVAGGLYADCGAVLLKK